jgi:hypothetical protein
MRTLDSVAVVLVAGAAACSATSEVHPFGSGGGSPRGSTTASSSTGAGQGGGLAFDAGIGTGAGSSCVVTDVNADMDGDGWTPAEGDCNDCDPNVNPGAIDTIVQGPNGPILGNEDCADKPGTIPGPCDDGLAVDDPSPLDAAKAVELCTPLTDPRKWGIKSAKWVLPDGSDPSTLTPTFAGSQAQATANYPLGYGILSAFGSNVAVQAGKRMLALSSGTARQPSDPGYMDVNGFDKMYTCGSPVGFPKESPACPGITTGQPHDGVALEVELVAPTNAKGFSFSFDFFTYEWPDFICSTFNDFFVALRMPFPAGQTDGNISFDSMGNPVSVNNAFLEVCGCASGPPCLAGGKSFTCALGDKALAGTGFGTDTAGEDHGSTYWLSTTAPVSPHEDFTLRWAVYDSTDGELDTTTLVDDFQWIATPGTVVVGTSPSIVK